MRRLVNLVAAKLHPRLLTKVKFLGKPLKPLPGVCSTERRAKSAALDAQGKNILLEYFGCTGCSLLASIGIRIRPETAMAKPLPVELTRRRGQLDGG